MVDRYVVAAKPSARRVSRAVGAWIATEGRCRSFDSKALAREWARTASPQGYTLWIQDAHPRDEDAAEDAERPDDSAYDVVVDDFVELADRLDTPPIA